MIEPVVLGEIQRITAFAKKHKRVSDKELRSAKNELEKANQRIVELDTIIKKIYEDNATGWLTDEHSNKLYTDYETEQSSLKTASVALKTQIDTRQQEGKNIDYFLKMVKKYTDVSELTPEIVCIFVEKIVCHQSNGRWGKNRRQQIAIYWNFIVLIEE